MSYTHLTISERVKIETYLELDYPIRKIVKLLNRHPSTISREIKRHAGSTADEEINPTVVPSQNVRQK